MSKKTIAVDLDDVIAASTDALRLEVNRVAGVQLTPRHYQIEGEYWGYYEQVWAENKIDHLVSFESLPSDMAVTQKHIKLIEGAKEALRKLKKQYHLVVVTSRKVEWVSATQQWLEDVLPGVFDGISFVHHEDNDARTKGDACIELGASWLIDDNVEHCFSAKNRGVRSLLFGDYGWNRRVPDQSYDLIVKDWQAVLEFFEHED